VIRRTKHVRSRRWPLQPIAPILVAWTRRLCTCEEGSWACHAGAVKVWPRSAKGVHSGCTMDKRDLWSGDVDKLIERLRMRLEQYQLHAETLTKNSRDRAGADAIVQRVQDRLDSLQEWRQRRSSNG
jgi:hypothetical protein